MNRRQVSRGFAVLGIIAASAAGTLAPLPSAWGIDAEAYRKIITEKNLGLALLEQEKPADARAHFERVSSLAPDDPLGPANAGLASVRMKDVIAADEWLRKAQKLAPKSAEVHALLAAWHEQGNRNDEAAAEYGKAIALDSKDRESIYRLARLLTHIGRPADKPKIRQLYQSLSSLAPGNLIALLRRSESDLDASDLKSAESGYRQAVRLVPALDAKARGYLEDGVRLLSEGKGREALPKVKIFENLLKATPGYQAALAELYTNVVGLPLVELGEKLRASAPRGPIPAIPIRFTSVRLGETSVGRLARGMDGVLAATRDGVRILSPGGTGKLQVKVLGERTPFDSVHMGDVDGDAHADLVALSAGAIRVFKGTTEGGFGSTSVAAGGIPNLADAVDFKAFDYDMDGDLDFLVLQPSDAARGGGVRIFRNHRDGTFTDETKGSGFEGSAIRAELLDFDGDGDTDVLLVEPGGRLRLLTNRRQGRFDDATKESGLDRLVTVVADLAVGDFDGDGRIDLVVADRATGAIRWLRNTGGKFAAGSDSPDLAGGKPFGDRHAFLALDADNDGFLDLLVVNSAETAGRQATFFRNAGDGRFSRTNAIPADSGVLRDPVALDFDRDGDQDVVGFDSAGELVQLRNDGGNANGWLEISLEALASGSGKVNRLGIGSTIEAKAGELYVLRFVENPSTWIGLGARSTADVVRVVWPNGIPQNEINVKGKRRFKEVQQLKGSCPFLYTWDGERFRFFTDILGRSPLGLRFDGVHLAAPETLEWLPIPGDRLRVQNGRAELRVTEELWEAAYLDEVRLESVDHPAGSAIVTNEKMIPPPFEEKRLDVVSQPRACAAAIDTDGHDIRAELNAEDGVYVSDFGPSDYQGISNRDHWIELDLGPEAASAAAPVLYLAGWIFYTDTSINVALSQDSRYHPQPPVLEIPDGKGGWRVAIPSMGFPSGKTKTMPVDLAGILLPGEPRVRIRTNLDIHWDRVFWSDGTAAPVRRTELPLRSASLRERGFSRRYRAVPDGPEIFDYDDVDRASRWRDMTGRYSATGDVREMLTAVDDRYVVFKGGDEISLSFDASRLPPIPEGFVRDWLFISDGWDKDADLNTLSGDTVAPLPFHSMRTYPYGPEESFPDDPVHREFVERTLTREITGEEFPAAICGPALRGPR